MKFGKRTMWAMAAWLVGVCMSAAVTAKPIDAALRQVSPNTQVVLVVPSLADLDGKLTLLNRQLVLGMPELNNALAQFKEASGIERGVRDDGALILVIEGLGGMFGGMMPRMQLLMPVSDYGAFVGNFGGSAEEAVTQLQLPSGQVGFARKLGDYALLGIDANDLRAYRPGNDADRWFAKAGTLGARYLQGSDIAVLVDLESLSPTLMGMTPMMQMMAEAGFAQLDPAEAAQARKNLQLMIAGWTAFLRDGRGLVIGLDMNDAGFGMTTIAQFKDNSPMAQMLKSGGEDAAAYLARLPDRPFLLAYSMNMEMPAMAKWMENVMDMMFTADPAMAEAMAVLKPTFADLKGTAGFLYADDEGRLSGLQYARIRDAAAFRDVMRQYIEKVNGLPVMPGSTQRVEASYTPNVMQIGDVQVDRFVTDSGEELAHLMGPLETLMKQDGLVAATGEHFISTMSPDRATLEAALASARGQGGNLGAHAGIAQTRAALTPRPLMEMYLDVRALAAFFEMEVPGDGPSLAAISVSANEGGVAYRKYVPTSVVRLIMQAAPALQEALGPF